MAVSVTMMDTLALGVTLPLNSEFVQFVDAIINQVSKRKRRGEGSGVHKRVVYLMYA